jgi:hypothetical protein
MTLIRLEVPDVMPNLIESSHNRLSLCKCFLSMQRHVDGSSFNVFLAALPLKLSLIGFFNFRLCTLGCIVNDHFSSRTFVGDRTVCSNLYAVWEGPKFTWKNTSPWQGFVHSLVAAGYEAEGLVRLPQRRLASFSWTES